MQLLSSLRWLHIAAGMTALSVLWLPLFAKKGSRLHVRAGLVYAWAMGIVALTGGPLALAMLADDKPANDLSALFLAYVGVLAGANSWIGVRALRTRRPPGSTPSFWRRASCSPMQRAQPSGCASRASCTMPSVTT